MAKSSKRKADPILPPGTYMVDNPAWDRDAPDIEVEDQPARARGPGRGAAPSKPVATPVGHKTGLAVIVMFGALLAAGIGGGVWWWLDQQRQAQASEDEGEQALTPAAAAAAAAAADAPPLQLEDQETRYKGRLIQTAAELEIEAPSVASLLEPNEFSNPVTHGSPVVIGPGGSKRFGALTLEVRVERLSLDRHEIHSKGEHTLLRLRNTGERPLAYRIIMRKKSNGDCLSPVVFNYDAMVIDPGATTELSVCTGRQSAEILDLRTLAVTPIGARWIRQIPPIVVGNTTLAARSHKLADPEIPQCNEDAQAITRALDEHLAKWEDVIDFYSRHDCQFYKWVSEYRLATQALAALPILPEQPHPE